MFVTVNDQQIFFDVVGSKLAPDGPVMREKPTLLVLHGGPGFDHSGLRGDFDGFADIAQVVYLDHRGNGRSVPSEPATWTLAQWGDDIRGFCDVLGIARPIVVGQSFGGMVAQSYATRHPDHPRALVLSSTAARMDLEGSMKIFEQKGGPEAGAIAKRFWDSGTDADFADYMRVCMPLYNRGALRRRRQCAAARDHAHRSLSPFFAAGRRDSPDGFPRRACPHRMPRAGAGR